MLALKDLVRHLLPGRQSDAVVFLVLPIDPVSAAAALFLASFCRSASGTILRNPWFIAK